MSMQISEIRQFAAANTGTLTVDSTGRFAKATFGERFRMFFNIGGARDENNRRVLDALKNAILDQVEFFGCDEAAVHELGTLQSRSALSGKDLSALFTRIDAIKSQTRGIEELTTAGLAAKFDHPAYLSFEKYGDVKDLNAIAKKFMEAAYRNALNDDRKNSFSVGTALSAFLCECQAMVEEAENGDPPLTDMLVKNFTKMLVRGDAKLRKPEDVIDNLKACHKFIQDARALGQAENKPYVVDIALSYVKRLGGATKIDQGEINALKELFPGAPLNGKYDLNIVLLKKYVLDATAQITPEVKTELKMALAENTNVALVDRLTYVLTRKFLTIPVFQGAMLKGGPENEQCMCYHQARTFAAMLPAEDRERLKTFFASPMAENLHAFYLESAFSGNLSNDITTMATQPMMQHVFAGLRDGILGRVVPPPKEGGTIASDFSKLPASVTCRLSAQNTIISRQGYVPAMGRYDAVKSTRFLKRTAQSGAGLLNCHLAKSMAGGENAVISRFKAAVSGRKLTVRLSDGTLLPDNPEKACDALARLLKGNQEATFDELNKSERTRALLMMSMLTKDLVDVSHRAVTTAIDSERKSPALVSGDGRTGEAEQTVIPPTIILALDDQGGISLHMDSQTPISQYTVESSLSWFSEREMFNVGRGSNVRTSLDVTIGAQEMTRLSELDWSQCDVRDAEQELGAGEHAKGWTETLSQKLPESFRINMDVTPTYSIYVEHQAWQDGANYPANFVRED